MSRRRARACDPVPAIRVAICSRRLGIRSPGGASRVPTACRAKSELDSFPAFFHNSPLAWPVFASEGAQFSVVAVAQLVESWIVIPVVVGSSPISHPTEFTQNDATATSVAVFNSATAVGV